jgi:hypothetical protein
MEKITYTPEKCGSCEQTTTYILALDRGTVKILKGIARAIGEKGINCVHIAKEVLARGFVTVNERSNIARPRAHGLIARVKGENMKGNYLLTKKGAAFLRGERVPRFAIMSKTKGHQVGYLEPEKHTVSIRDFDAKGEYWEGIGYDIVEGRVVPADRLFG